MYFSSVLTWRPISALCFALARSAFVVRPWVVFDAAIRAVPSSVLEHVLRPPWNRQRPFCLVPGRWNSVPLRVRASHLVPCQLGRYSHGLTLLLVLSDNWEPFSEKFESGITSNSRGRVFPTPNPHYQPLCAKASMQTSKFASTVTSSYLLDKICQMMLWTFCYFVKFFLLC